MRRLFLIPLVFFTGLTGYGQERIDNQVYTLKNLVFEGAGIRGIAYAGVIKSLEERNLAKDIAKIGGTSAGAISSLLFALGYSSGQMDTIISNTKFQKFNDGKFLFVGGISRTFKKYGWYRGEEFSEWIGELIEAKTGDSEITFKELHEGGYIDLYVTASCLNQQRLVVLSRETYPKMKVKDAVRISMSIPLYFQAVLVDSVGNIYFKQGDKEHLDIMVDGGIVGNFPIHIFDSVYVDSTHQQIRLPNSQTLGIRIDTDSQIDEDKGSRKLAPYPINDFMDYISAFYVMVIENLNRTPLTEEDWNRTISISSVGITPKVKKLSGQQKRSLVTSGYRSTEFYLNEKLK
jgi:NTE family protein